MDTSIPIILTLLVPSDLLEIGFDLGELVFESLLNDQKLRILLLDHAE